MTAKSASKANLAIVDQSEPSATQAIGPAAPAPAATEAVEPITPEAQAFSALDAALAQCAAETQPVLRRADIARNRQEQQVRRVKEPAE